MNGSAARRRRPTAWPRRPDSPQHLSAGRAAGITVLVVEPDDHSQLLACVDAGHERLPTFFRRRGLPVSLRRPLPAGLPDVFRVFDVADDAAESQVGVIFHARRRCPLRIDPVDHQSRPIFARRLPQAASQSAGTAGLASSAENAVDHGTAHAIKAVSTRRFMAIRFITARMKPRTGGRAPHPTTGRGFMLDGIFYSTRSVMSA